VTAPAAAPAAVSPDVRGPSTAAATGPTYYLVGSTLEARRVRETGDEAGPYHVLIISSPDQAAAVMAAVTATGLGIAIVDLRGE
jgi:hypothetical protein